MTRFSPDGGASAAAAFAKNEENANRVTIGGAAAPVSRTCATRYCTRTAAPRGTHCGAILDPNVDLSGAGHLSVGLGARLIGGNSTFVIPTRRAPFLFDCDWPRYVVEVLWP